MKGLVDVKELLEGALAVKVRGVVNRIMPLIIHEAADEEGLRTNILNAMKPEFVRAKKSNRVFNPEKATIARFANILVDAKDRETFETRIRQVFKKSRKFSNNPYLLFKVFNFAWRTKFELPAEAVVLTGRITVKQLKNALSIMERRLKISEGERERLAAKFGELEKVLCEKDAEIDRLKIALEKNTVEQEKGRRAKVRIIEDQAERKTVIEIFEG